MTPLAVTSRSGFRRMTRSRSRRYVLNVSDPDFLNYFILPQVGSSVADSEVSRQVESRVSIPHGSDQGTPRTVIDLRGTRFGETVPPLDPYQREAAVDSSAILQDLRALTPRGQVSSPPSRMSALSQMREDSSHPEDEVPEFSNLLLRPLRRSPPGISCRSQTFPSWPSRKRSSDDTGQWLCLPPELCLITLPQENLL